MTPNLILAAMLLAAPNATDTWPGFRGDGSSRTAAKDLPLKWSSKENTAWHIDTPGYGQSAPVVWKEKVYLTSVEGEMKEKLHVVCVSTADGKTLWTKSFTATQKGKNNPMMSRAAGTPVADESGVVAFFESGDVIALTHEGKVRWERALAKDLGELKNNHGLGSSPAQTAKCVLVLVDHQGPSCLLAIDKETGKDAWKAERTARSSWTSPIVATIAGKPVAVVSSGGAVTGYDADSGKQLWELTGLAGNTIPSATMSGDSIVIGAGENRMKPDADATAKANCCLTISGGDKPGYVVAWQGKKIATGTASPLIHAGHVYFTDKLGFAICVDAKTGEEKYRERLDNTQWATPIGAGDYVYFFGKDGITTVLKAGAVYEKVESNRLWTAEDYKRRMEEAKKKAAATLPKPPEGKGPGGGPPLPKEELEATRYSAIGDVVYGVGAIDGTFFLRTGTQLFCIRKAK